MEAEEMETCCGFHFEVLGQDIYLEFVTTQDVSKILTESILQKIILNADLNQCRRDRAIKNLVQISIASSSIQSQVDINLQHQFHIVMLA